MYNGNVKLVQDIQDGDLIMGDDSTSRTVLSTCKGQETLYKIIPDFGNPYIVNESHILSFVSTEDTLEFKKYHLYDIPVIEYLKLPDDNPLNGYKVPINFQTKVITMDPYILGYWLGDSNVYYRYLNISNINILNYIMNNFITNHVENDIYSIVDDSLIGLLKYYNVYQNKHIPHNYKINSYKIRMGLLSGLIDSSGFYKLDDSYEFIFKNEVLIDDIIFLAASLGFATLKEVLAAPSFDSCFSEIYYKAVIYGNGLNKLSLFLTEKRVSSIIYSDVLQSKIHIEKLNKGDYYGFEIDGNRRFVLGDFTVTHNTTMAIYIMCELKKKTLIIVHKEFLLNQWKERIEQFAPKARIGLIKGPTVDIQNKDIVLGSLQSLSMKEYDKDVFASFGNVVIDECFPYEQYIITDKGTICIGDLHKMWKNKEKLPLIKSFNIETSNFEWKQLTYAWEKQATQLLEITVYKTKIKCTLNHKILTPNGMIEAEKLNIGDLVIGCINNTCTKFKIISTKLIDSKSINVYDIEVEDNHNFLCSEKTNMYGVCCKNCHHIGSEVFSRALNKINFKYSLGLSATVKRKDNLSKVFMWYLGDIIFKTKKNIDKVHILLKEFYDSDPNYGREIKNYFNKLNIPIMINNICEFLPRIVYTIDILEEVLKDEPDRKVVLLSDRRNHLQLFKEELDKRNISNGFVYGGLKPIIIEESEKQQVILGTYAYLQEGYDCPGLNTLILASPKSELEQIIGRIQRDKIECRKYTPLVIDIIDNFSLFKAQAKKRQKYYNSKKYKIIGENNNIETEKFKLNGTCQLKDI
jgi:superfamily II DNA or RNA helicase